MMNKNRRLRLVVSNPKPVKRVLTTTRTVKAKWRRARHGDDQVRTRAMFEIGGAFYGHKKVCDVYLGIVRASIAEAVKPPDHKGSEIERWLRAAGLIRRARGRWSPTSFGGDAWRRFYSVANAYENWRDVVEQRRDPAGNILGPIG